MTIEFLVGLIVIVPLMVAAVIFVIMFIAGIFSAIFGSHK